MRVLVLAFVAGVLHAGEDHWFERVPLPSSPMSVRVSVAADLPVAHLLDTVARRCRVVLAYDPDDRRIRGQVMGARFSHAVPAERLFGTYEAILAFYEIDLVALDRKRTWFAAPLGTYGPVDRLWSGSRRLVVVGPAGKLTVRLRGNRASTIVAHQFPRPAGETPFALLRRFAARAVAERVFAPHLHARVPVPAPLVLDKEMTLAQLIGIVAAQCGVVVVYDPDAPRFTGKLGSGGRSSVPLDLDVTRAILAFYEIALIPAGQPGVFLAADARSPRATCTKGRLAVAAPGGTAIHRPSPWRLAVMRCPFAGPSLRRRVATAILPPR